jgi:sulfoxide reductase heme-binding subunit YedZ
MTTPDPAHYGWWLASRASGVIALGLISLSVGLGLAMAAGVLRRPGLKRQVVKLHEHVALVALVAIAVHGLTLLGDAWLRPGLTGIAIPFAMSYRPLYTGLGIVAAYLAAGLGLSFYARRRIGARLWRRLHRFTVLVFALGVVHALGAGTDAGSLWLRGAVALVSVPVALLLALRLLARPRRRAARRPPGPVPARARS